MNFNNTTMKKYAALSIILLSFSTLFAQGGGNVIYEQNNRYIQNKSYNADAEQMWDYRGDNQINERLISTSDKEMIFTVNALMNIKADAYLAIFNITQTGQTAKEVDLLVNTKIEGFKKELAANNITDVEIFADMISLVPVYEFEMAKKLFSKTYTEVPQGFEMQKNIHVRFKNEALLDKIITSAASNEIYDFIKLEYFVDNNAQKYIELRDAAVKSMKLKIENFKQLGINLDTVYHIISEKSSVVYPIDRYESYQAYTGTSLEAMKNKEVISVRKPKTMFYNKLPYHKFDIILNPSLLEPSVQFTYSLTLKYVVKEDNKTKKEFILVTPEGIVKTLKID
jgi:uncharacterized protein YggE